MDPWTHESLGPWAPGPMGPWAHDMGPWARNIKTLANAMFDNLLDLCSFVQTWAFTEQATNSLQPTINNQQALQTGPVECAKRLDIL